MFGNWHIFTKYCYLQLPQLASHKQSQRGKPDSLNGHTIHLTPAAIHLTNCGNKGRNTGCDSLNNQLAIVMEILVPIVGLNHVLAAILQVA